MIGLGLQRAQIVAQGLIDTMARSGPAGLIAEVKRAGLYCNAVSTPRGLVRAVCSCCGRKSPPCKPNSDGEPDLWNMPRGWWEAPFPHDTVHWDGSVGSTFTCPACHAKMRAGERLQLRAYVPPGTPLRPRQFIHPRGWLAGTPFLWARTVPGRWLTHCHIGGPQAFAWNANASSQVRTWRRK